MHINFLTIDDVSSGLFRTQVMDLAKSISDLDPGISIRIIVVNRPWKLLSHRVALNKYSEQLIGSNVHITYIPILPPLRGVVSNTFASEILITLLRLCSAFVALHGEVDVWHARGYWATIALQRNKCKNLLFDPRSLWIQENQSAGNLKYTSNAYKYWLSNEKIIAESARYVAVVSKGMMKYYKERYQNSKIGIIPISANEIFFNFNKSVRCNRRIQLGWEDNVIFVYSGSLGLSGINANALVQLFHYLLSFKDARLLFLSDENEEKILALMSTIPVDLASLKVIRPVTGEIWEWLAASDVGVHGLPRQLDSNTRLGTKVVEYWASGLPVIVNNNVGAACDYINENSYLGYVINFEKKLPSINKILSEIMGNSRELIQFFARKNFHSSLIAKKYIHEYETIACNKLL
jgi:glycosyltransferase involved in cell wall biosynthesis